MTFVLSDRVKEVTSTTGTSDMVLGGAVGAATSFSSTLGDGDKTYYCVEASDGGYEVGIGTYTLGTNTLSRDTVISSSNSGSKITLTGVSEVFCTQPGSKAVFTNPEGLISGVDTSFQGFAFPDGTVQYTSATSGNAPVTLERQNAGVFFNYFVNNAYDETVSLHLEDEQYPRWKMGLRDSATGNSAPTYGYIFAEQGYAGGVADSTSEFYIASNNGLWIKHNSQNIANFAQDDGIIFQNVSSTAPTFTVKGAAAQAQNLQSWNNSSSTTLAKVTKDGHISGVELHTPKVLFGDGTIQTTAMGVASGDNVSIFTNDAGYLTTHPSISAASSSDNATNVFIQDITVDSNGHVTAIGTASAFEDWNINSDDGVPYAISDGNTLQLVGGTNVTTSYNNSTKVLTITSTDTDTNTTYTAGDGVTLVGTTFSAPDIATASGSLRASITSNSTDITTASGALRQDVTTNATDIVTASGSLRSSISTNATDISTNTSSISLKTPLTSFYASGQAYTDSRGAISGNLQTQIDGISAGAENYTVSSGVIVNSNFYTISGVNGLIPTASGALRADITTNTAAIPASGYKISGVLQPQITTNASDIATNTSSIATKTPLTSFYASGQAYTDSRVAISGNLQPQITTNTSNISTNTSNISLKTPLTDFYASGQAYTDNRVAISGNLQTQIDGVSSGAENYTVSSGIIVNNNLYTISGVNGLIPTASGALRVDIIANTTAIPASGYKISGVLQPQITSNTSSISTNTSSIATKTPLTSFYASGQAYTDSRVAISGNLQPQITTNASDIATNTSSVATKAPLTSFYASGQAYTDSIALKSNIASPTFTGTPAAPTAAALTSTTQIATTAFVVAEVAALVDTAPATLNTLNELAAALGDDANFSTTVTNSIATKTPLTSFYASGQAYTDSRVAISGNLQPQITTNASDIATNTSSVATKTPLTSFYASGQVYTDSIATKIGNLVEDTTPQLGGTLQANSQIIDMGVYTITDAKVGQWDTAYGWGDHSSGGYQSSDAGLTSIAGLTTAADKMIYTTASDTYAVAAITTAGRAILDDADASAQRTTLGLGALATLGSVAAGQIDANAVDSSELVDGSIDESHLNATGAADNYLLSYDAASAGFTWVAAGGGGSMSTFIITDGVTPQTIDEGETITLADGVGAEFVTSATNTVTVNSVDSEIDHDSLSNFVTNEHIDWTTSSAGTIHASNYTDTTTNTQLTEDQVDDYVAGLLTAGSNVSLTYDDTAGTLTIASTYTDTNTTYTGGTNLTLAGTAFNVDDAFLKNDASDVTTGTITAGGFTTAGTLTVDSIGISTIQSSAESFADNDTSLMTSAAIANKIEAYGYGTSSGDMTGVDLTAGAGITIDSETNPTSGDYSATITCTVTDTDTNTQLSTEEVQDIAGPFIATGGTKTLIAVTYDDINNDMDFVVDNNLANYDNSSSGFITATLTEEEVEDFVGGMLGGTETGITVTYQDVTHDIDFVVADTTVAGDTGSTGMTPGDTLTIAGGTNVTTAMSGDTLTITSIDTTYSVSDGGLTQINFTSADNTKLDGIEASANNYSHTTNANLTGDVTSIGNATTIATDAVDIAMLSATGTASGSTFLRGDNTWVTPTDTDTTYSEATGSAEGLMSTAHHDKLDGIEASADVTDATNVTAAGALMDSELAGIAAVKATTGTFLTADQTKLDGIAASANNYTLPSASLIAVGGVELATTTETTTGTDTARAVTPAGVQAAIDALIGGAPGALDTLNELAAAIGDDDDYASTITTALGLKATLASPTFTGTVAIPNVANLETAVVANTAKATNVSTNLATTTSTTTAIITSSDGTDATIPVATTSVGGVMSKAIFDQHTANVAKNTNVSTALSTGTVDATSYGITSDGGSDDIILAQATTSVAGVLSAAKWDEIVANTAKSTNVVTNLTATANGTSLTVNSSDGTNVSLPAATTSAWGVMSDDQATKLDGIEASADVTDTANVVSALTAGTNVTISAGGTIASTDTTTNTMGSGFTVSATTDTNATTITEGDDLLFTAGTGITCETTADGTVTITNTVSNTNTQLSEEQVEDFVGGMLGGTETGITVTYQDATHDIDFVVADTTVAGDSGSTGITPGDTLTIAGGTNVTTAMSGDTLTITSTDTNTTYAKADFDLDHLFTLVGAAADTSVDLGTFTGSTVADSVTIKVALQSLETAVETKGVTAGSSSIVTVGTIGTGTWQGTAIGASYVATLNQNTTGSAATLTTPRAINGVNFNGSAPITVTAAGSTLSDTVTVAKGGTAQTSYTNGQLLIGNTTGNTLAKATLTAGDNVTITNGAGAITIAATDTNTTYTKASFDLDHLFTLVDAAADTSENLGTFTGSTISDSVTIKAALQALETAVETKGVTAGSSSIVTVGTIGTGTWQGTAIATAYIADDAITGAKIALFDDSLAATTTHFLIADGTDYSSFALSGDVTCTNAGAVTVAADAITYAKIQNVSATDKILGRDSAGAGIIEEISPANLRTMINVEDGATADQSNAEIKTAIEAGTDIALGGNPTTTTQSAGNNSTRIATTAYADVAVAALVDSAPAALDTLNELAAALGDDAGFSTTVTNSIATKMPLAGGAFAGAVTTNSTFDGRDVATDGTKLDGIEASATADQSAAEIKTLLEDGIDSVHYVDGSIDLIHLAADSVDGTKIADSAINSEHYADGSIDNAHIADDAIDSEHYAAGSIDTAHIADDQITLAKMAGITRGSIIIGDASGDPAALAIGSSTYVLTSDGTDIAWAAGGDITAVVAGTGMTGGATSGSATVNVIGGDGITANDNDVAVTPAQTTITSLLAADIKIGEDDQTKIDFETVDTINFYAGNEKQLILTDGALTPGTNAIVDLGTDALEFKDGYFDGTLEADAITIGGTALNTVIAGVTVTNATNAVTATNANHVAVADNESTDENNLITFIEDASATGNVGLESDGDFHYNPSTGTVTATIFKGNVDAVDGDFDGTLEADAITVGGTALNTVIAGVTVTNATNAVTATNANHVAVADNESTDENNLIPFIEDASATGNVGLESDGDFHYNPSSGTITATIFKGNIDAVDGDFDGTLEADAITIGGTALNTVIAGVTVTNATTAVNATHVAVADNESTDENNLITFIEDASATGNVGLESDGDFHYNPSTGTVTATIFKGNIDAVDGDFDGTLEADAITLGGTALGSLYSVIAGSSSILTVGTIGTGIWQGTAIAGGYIANDAIDSQHYAAASIDYAHVQNVAANSILGRNANSAGVLSEIALTTTQILIGDGTGFTAAALSGDVTMTNAGVVSIADDVVSSAELADACTAVTSFTAPLIEGSTSVQTPLIEYTDGDDAITIADGGLCTFPQLTTFSKAIKPGLKADTDGATVTFDLNEPNMHTVTLGGNRTFAISNETAGQRFIIRVLQDGTGSRLVSTWFSTIKWAGGSAPTLTTTANKADVFGFIVTGTDTYDGFIVGQNV